jgi:rRNA maturation protein Rpf1
VILLTTSRRPTRAMRTFCHDLKRVIPNTVRINRGKASLESLAEKAIGLNANRIIVVDRWHGGVGKIQFFNLTSSGLVSVYPTMQVAKVKLQREFGEKRLKPTKKLALSNLSQNSEANAVAQSLSKFLDIPILSLEEAVSKAYEAVMQISQDSSKQLQITFIKLPMMKETGPRITINHLTW